MGYSSVETYGFNGDKFLGHTLKEVSDIVKDMGMTLSGTHTGSGMLPEDINAPEWDIWKKISTEIASGGGKWAVSASLPLRIKTLDDIKRIAAHFNRVAEVCKKADIKFAFHNHYEVFSTINGEVPFDFLIKNTDPKLVFFQLDLGHTINGGGDCVHYIRTYANRIPLWHASDFNLAYRQYRELGRGHVPYKDLFDLPNAGGLQLLTVEQETGGDIFASCKEDFDYLKQFKWTEA
jgi:sugar phosphate isomerase/epimerase